MRLILLFVSAASFLAVVGFKNTGLEAFNLGGSISWKSQIEEVFAPQNEAQLKNFNNNTQASLFVDNDPASMPLNNDDGPPLSGYTAFLGEQAPFVSEGSRAKTLGITSHKVEPGETASSIASKYHLKVATILGANDLRYGDYIRAGEVLLILPKDAVLHKVKSGESLSSIAEKYGVEVESIAKENFLLADGSDLETSQEILVPGITPKIEKAASVPAAGSGSGTLANYDDYFSFPTTGRNWGKLHYNNGVDISNACGTEVYAAASGRVSDVALTSSANRWANGGYGNYLKITHSNGTETMYSHLLAVLVNPGDSVSKGQVVAWMGGRPGTVGAGNSTGCHLHFEVKGARNPFIRYR